MEDQNTTELNKTEAAREPKPLLWIIVPCYNEQEVLPVTAPLFREELEKMISAGKVSRKSRILFVNDGSADSTWDIIQELARKDETFLGISQSRNRGHQNAVLAGLMEAREHCDITISIDCDGQDDVSAMERMVDAYLSGAEVVYGVRSSRKSDSFFKRITARSFYRLMNVLGAEVVYDHADYRLVSSRVLQEFADFHEVNLFLRGMIPLVGFPSASVSYERQERMAGSSHYPLRKMLQLAFDGITSLSVKPINMIAGLGGIISLIGFLGVLWAIIQAVRGATVAGWASIICIVCFLGGIQLLSIGVIGEYIGKIYLESKHRPRYIISERTWEPYERHYKG
ncbi:MAG: glycosyltransferase family 2 protein [Stomatobaculum sp.]|nr:glycosyltransferase family 2 protein [Stomatobaculum sp.]